MDPSAPSSMPHASASFLKEELRARLRERRRRLRREEQQAAAAGLADQVLDWLHTGPPAAISAGSRVIAAYLSAPPEPGTEVLLPALVEAGYDVVVPVCEPLYQLSWVRWRLGVELAKSPRAPLWEPVGERLHFEALPPFRLVLVPGLGMDEQGNRIGQGGGYYDRFLAQLILEQPEVSRLGYLYDEEILPAGSVEATPLDMPLPGAFTPSALYRLPGGYSTSTHPTV